LVAMKKLPFFLPFGGCRGRCVYCQQETITGTVRAPSPQEVRGVLLGLSEPREVCYFGGSFCRFEKDLVKSYLDAVAECAPRGSRIRFSTYPGDLRRADLRNMVLSYPISCIELGIPSLDPEVLEACARDADPAAILEDVAVLASECAPLAVQMMIGLPKQSVEGSLEGLRRLADIKGPVSWELRLYPCLVLGGTELESMMERGDYKPLSVEEAAIWGGKFITEASDLGFIHIRVGLQESDLLRESVKGGPHSAALGELILADSYARKLARNSRRGPWIIPLRHISKFKGHGSFGLKRLAHYSGLALSEAERALDTFTEAPRRTPGQTIS
jgi:histone acetyltransferase (RNA polymerase elongator complex component)